MGIGNILTKAAGITGLALIAYDSHMAGKISAHQNEKTVSYTHLTLPKKA